MSDTLGTTRHKLFGPFLWAVTVAGSLAFVYSFSTLNLHHLDSGFVILVAMTLVLSSQISVPIPRFSSQISVSDTFVFLLLLLYGGAAAVSVGAIEACLSSLRFARKPRIVVFNFGCSAVSIFIRPWIFFWFLPGARPSVEQLCALFVLTNLVNLLTVVPGGLGWFEAAMAGYASATGLGDDRGVGFALVSRMADLRLAVLETRFRHTPTRMVPVAA